MTKISESIRSYVYLILTSQASARSSIIGKDAEHLEAQSIFIQNFEDLISRPVDISEDISRYQKTLFYASIEVNFCVGEGLYMIVQVTSDCKSYEFYDETFGTFVGTSLTRVGNFCFH